MEKQIKALATELRKVGIRGKVNEYGGYTAPKTVEADQLEAGLRAAGWKQIKSGIYYTDYTTWDKIPECDGVFQKDGLEARVRWGNTKSSNPPSLSLKMMVQ